MDGKTQCVRLTGMSAWPEKLLGLLISAWSNFFDFEPWPYRTNDLIRPERALTALRRQIEGAQAMVPVHRRLRQTHEDRARG